MRMLLAGLGCGLMANHDLWLDIRVDDDSQFNVHAPANWIVDQESAVDIETPDGRIDLREEARQLRESPGVGSRTWTLTDSSTTITLKEQRVTTGPHATTLRIGAKGPKGFGLGVTVPLFADREQRCAEALGQHLQVEQVEIKLGPEFCGQLAKSRPTTLLSTTGGLLGGVTIVTE